MRTVYVNEAYRPQRVSGQQRYAGEISDRLPASVVRIAPAPFWASSRLRTWLWVQTVLPIRTWRGVLISLTARAPVWHPRHVLVIHDLFVIEHPEWFSRKFQLTHAPLLRFQIATAKSLIAVSEPVAEQLTARRPSATVVVAPNAPSEVFADSAALGDDVRDDVLSRLGLDVGRYLMVVGNFDPRKNLVRLAAAYGLLSAEQRADMPLVVVGGGADIYRQAPIEWPSGTVVTGYLEDAALGILYANSLAFVFPTLAEGFGLPIVEAVISGATRLLVSDIPVFRWICGEGGATYVNPASVADLAAALRPDRIAQIPPPESSVRRRFDWSTSAAAVRDSAWQVTGSHAKGEPAGPGTSTGPRDLVIAPAPGNQVNSG